MSRQHFVVRATRRARACEARTAALFLDRDTSAKVQPVERERGAQMVRMRAKRHQCQGHAPPTQVTKHDGQICCVCQNASQHQLHYSTAPSRAPLRHITKLWAMRGTPHLNFLSSFSDMVARCHHLPHPRSGQQRSSVRSRKVANYFQNVSHALVQAQAALVLFSRSAPSTSSPTRTQDFYYLADMISYPCLRDLAS
jgi:hypothetical protein